MDTCAIIPLSQSAAAFAPVAGEASLVRVVRALQAAIADDRIVVATVPECAADATTCLRAAGLESVAVVVPREGGTRAQLLATGLKSLAVERLSAAAVLIGDLGHPLAPGAVADRVIAALQTGHDVVVPTQPVTDTVKIVDEQGSVLGTVDRTTLRTVQFPRGFRASVLWDLLSESAAAEDGAELGLAMRAGLAIATVAGDPDGFRIALPRDERLLAAIIAGHSC